MRFVLSGNTNAANTRIDAIGQDKIDDTEFTSKRHSWLGTPVCQLIQTTSLPTCENQCQRFTRQSGDTAFILHSHGVVFFVETQLSLSRIDAFGKAPVISRNIDYARMNIKSQKYILDACTLAIENAITSA